jgi:hypothetical protein
MSAPKPARPEQVLERILDALETGLIAATDDEILAAAKELGMNPAMRGSAAFTEVRILLAQRQLRGVRLRTAEDDDAEPQHNGTPVARIILKRDAPQSR